MCLSDIVACIVHKIFVVHRASINDLCVPDVVPTVAARRMARMIAKERMVMESGRRYCDSLRGCSGVSLVRK